MSRAITDQQLVLEQQGLCNHRADAAGTEELREGDKQVDGKYDNVSHRADRTMTASAFKAARGEPISSYCEFATHRFNGLDAQAAAKVTTTKLRMELGNTSNVKWFAGIGQYVIDWGPGYRIYLAKDGESPFELFGGGTKRRQQADIDRAKALHAEYKARKTLPPADDTARRRKR